MHVAISAVGRDRPGIVAAVSGALHDAGCNLEDTSMTILRGHFAMMLIVDSGGRGVGELEQRLRDAADAFDLVLTVRAIDDEVPQSPEGTEHVVSVYGADQPGIVAAISSVLAAQGVNVIDLSTRMIGEADRPAYTMILEVTVPPGVDPAAVESALNAEADRLGVEASMHADDVDIL